MNSLLLTRLTVETADQQQGEYLRTDAERWHCGDDACDCSQVIVVRVHRNALAPRAFWFVRIAQGPFYSDGEGWETAKVELAEAQRIANEDRQLKEEWA